MSGFLSLMATRSGRRLKRLDKTASLVGLKYVVDGLEGELQLPSYSNHIVVMLLLVGPVWDRRYNTYICCRSNRQIEPLGPDIFDVVLDILEIESPLHSCRDKIIVKNRGRGFPWRERGVQEPLEPSPGYAPGSTCISASTYKKKQGKRLSD